MSATVEARPLRVVIIDDTAELRDLLRIALSRGGMSVVGEAGDGLTGIEAVRTAGPDVILLDLSMPVMDGLEALPHIRQLAPEAKIVVLSGFGADELTQRAIEAGADGYLQKGVSLGRILDYIRDITSSLQLDWVAPDRSMAELSAVSPAVGPTASDSLPADSPSDDGAWGNVLGRAPFGVIELSADEPYRLVRLNPAARELLADGPTLPGTPLMQICPALAIAIAENRLRGDIDFEASTGTELTQVSLRHHASSLVVYLLPVSDEVGTLRSAIATTAHEIRGPVGVLSGVAETLALVGDGELDPALRGRLMETAQRQARMLETITADLLTAAQIQRGTLRIEPRTLDPIPLIETLIQDRYPGGVTVEVGDRRPVFADGLRLVQMIGNLLCNADKYGLPPIVLRTRVCDGRPECLCIDVQDNGPGVSPEFQSQLFREFSRASGTVAAGTGLGLHVVRSLAQAQGGAVSYSAPPEGGAVFTLTLQTAAWSSDENLSAG